MLIAPVNHIKSMLGKQNPPNHGESRCLFPKDIKKRASVRERIRRMEKQKKALVEETARGDEWRSGTAGAVSQTGERFSSSYLICTSVN